jgi:DnaJ-domain-containing protein 1
MGMAAVRTLRRKNLLEDSVLDQTSEELVRFDRSRRAFEERLKELGGEPEQHFQDVVQWMRAVVAKKAPELLDD